MRLVRMTSLVRFPSPFAKIQLQRRVLFSQTPPPSLLRPRRSDTPPPSFLRPRRSNSLVPSPSTLSQIQCRGLFSRTTTPSLASPVRSDSLVPSPSPLSRTQSWVLFSRALPGPSTTMNIPDRYSLKNPMDLVTDQDLKSVADGLLDSVRYLMDKKYVVRTEGETEKKVRWNSRPVNRYLQLYSIRFLEYDREDIDQVCGSIRLGNPKYVLFNRQIGQDRFEIDAEGFLRLNGPEDPIWAIDYTTIYTNLYRENQPDDFFHPVGGVKYRSENGILLIDDGPSHSYGGVCGTNLSLPEKFEDRPCNTLITEKIETIFGITEVAYAIFTDAADSYLTIKLLYWRGDGFAPNIYGSIVASDTLCRDDFRAKSLVFDTKRDEEVLSVPVGHYIPLRRPMNVVPMYNSLKVDICLYHKNSTGSRGDDPLILKRTLDFVARCGAEGENTFESKELSGKWCALQVTAHWLPYWSLG